ncbi:hypothetical protein PUV54_00230 [Hyphococcus flavus]|uniref:Tyr recombinase domain-containing protein n=1 Tax=Hyphococcus flavus TaxID=1866326 RepID=A0AAE9ZJE4_9PROT|nr:hypothetical protein [Hyphococcus flavus]WDI31620.1 hypothetical protein PUV54_00230 [Hyphococcus flavus]
MTNGRKIALKGLAVSRAKGRTYYYAWRGGPRLTAPYGSAEFLKQFADAHAARKALPEADTIAGLILAFRASREFKALAKATKKDHERAFPHILREFGGAPVAAFDDPRIRRDIRKWHDGFDLDRQADKMLGSLSRLLSFAEADGLIARNPALAINNRYHRAPAPAPLTEAALETVLTAATTPPEAAYAILLCARSGFSRTDAASVTWAHVKHDRIDKRRDKSKIRATPPMTPELRQCLDDMPRPDDVLTILTNADGRPWPSADALGKIVNKALHDAGLDHTMHDLRATYACFLMRKGATDEEVADALGWSIDTVRFIRRHYVDDEAIFAGRIAKFAATASAKKNGN